jgi:hypothetical protein
VRLTLRRPLPPLARTPLAAAIFLNPFPKHGGTWPVYA